MDIPAVLYTRELPGGGYVAIESAPGDGNAYRAHVTVERRADPARRSGHTPPVIVELAGASQSEVFSALHRIASDNVKVATAILRWQSTRRRGR
ncbi:MAG TPA: hypothetical protein VMM18_06560 [Gemmatimonadaceae bacterium]|nr:hypothetical protein [Gemmatimonadaceae bacterium]